MNSKQWFVSFTFIGLIVTGGCTQDSNSDGSDASLPPTPIAAVQPTPQPTLAPAPKGAVNIRVFAGARQTFSGLGASIGNWGGEYQKLTPAQRTELSKLLWHDLKFNTLRLWMNTDEYSPTQGAHDLTNFKKMYVDSGIITDAKQQGVTTLLLAPDKLPPYMRDGNNIKDGEVENYAVLLADFIARLKQETSITIEATGIQNEPNNANNGPGQFSPAQIVTAVKKLRSELDNQGLQDVKIIAPEAGSADDTFYGYVDALKADSVAWNAIAGVSSHSYNMAATDAIATRIEDEKGGNTKEYWMTEASDNGPEEPGNAPRAISLAARFLNDMNHRATHWVHFLGFETDGPKDNATRIIAYTISPYKKTIFQKYYAYQQLGQTFDVGSVFRDSQSSLDGDMTWTFGQKPSVFAASAQNPDGSWGVGIANFTANSFSKLQGWSDEKWNKEQGGHSPAQSYAVTVQVDELKDKGDVPFVIHRTNSKQQNASDGTIVMKNGQVTIQVAPMELVTLRSQK